VVGASLDATDAEIVLVGPDDVIAGLPAARHVGVGRWEGGGARDALALAGRLTGLSIEAAVRLWREGAVDAIVTGPGHKRALHAGGYPVPGHTELLRDLTDEDLRRALEERDFFKNVLVEIQRDFQAEGLGKCQHEIDVGDPFLCFP